MTLLIGAILWQFSCRSYTAIPLHVRQIHTTDPARPAPHAARHTTPARPLLAGTDCSSQVLTTIRG
jgi:hypothetical protein